MSAKTNSISILMITIVMGTLYVFNNIDNSRLAKRVSSLEQQLSILNAQTNMDADQLYMYSVALSKRLMVLETLEMMRQDPDFQDKQKQYKDQLEKQGGKNADK